MDANNKPGLMHPGDIQIGNTILAQMRKKYLKKVEIYLALGSCLTLVTRFFATTADAHGLGMVIWLIQVICISLVIYAAWQLLTPKGNKFRNFMLDQTIVVGLEQTLTQQGWQVMVAIKCNRQGDHFCVDDILVALNGNKKSN